ncbi:hypothetical protein N7535_008490 [Penicillium sp. DV-2018c]|nr:hypothetical protein N7461_002250 [Penicillium sp. DV-2018c]KAJ5563326.1 hypothetical protein N7535_008490 [Penicillium sp. DV-2018c]
MPLHYARVYAVGDDESIAEFSVDISDPSVLDALMARNRPFLVLFHHSPNLPRDFSAILGSVLYTVQEETATVEEESDTPVIENASATEHSLVIVDQAPSGTQIPAYVPILPEQNATAEDTGVPTDILPPGITNDFSYLALERPNETEASIDSPSPWSGNTPHTAFPGPGDGPQDGRLPFTWYNFSGYESYDVNNLFPNPLYVPEYLTPARLEGPFPAEGGSSLGGASQPLSTFHGHP